MAITDNLSLSLVEQNQSQKEITVNEALVTLDALLNTAVINKDLTTPPPTPSSGDLYIVANGASGTWAGKDQQLAWYNQIWRFITPRTGLTLWVSNDNALYTWLGTQWIALIHLNSKKSIALPASLWTSNAGSEAAGALTTIEVAAGKPHIKAIPFTNSGIHRIQHHLILPETWNHGGFEVSVHWLTQTSPLNNVVWRVTGCAIGDGDIINADYASDTLITDTSQGANKLNITTSTLISIGGTIQPGDCVELQVSRQFTGTDTINATVYFLGMEIRYFSDLTL